MNCLTSDYTTVDNIQLFKGQHVQIIQRLGNDLCLVHVINNNNNNNNNAESTSDLKSKQLIEVQIPAQLFCKSSFKNYNNCSSNKFISDSISISKFVLLSDDEIKTTYDLRLVVERLWQLLIIDDIF